MDEVVFLDANIFLEVALGDAKQEACKALLAELVAGRRKGYTSDFIMYSCLLQIQHKAKDRGQMEKFIIFLNSIPSLQIIRCSLSEIRMAITSMQKHRLDFDDALVVSCMAHKGISALYSMDRDFDRVSTIRRLEP